MRILPSGRRALAMVAVVCLSACTGPSHDSTQPISSPASSASPTASGSVTSPPQTATQSRTASPAQTSSTAAATPSDTISIPPNLCAATDKPQNTADAYMGALSAANASQATACVYPGTVPAATTRRLLAKVQGTAVYLPQQGVDGPTVFGYQGNGLTVRVTVEREPDGTTWVTKVDVSAG